MQHHYIEDVEHLMDDFGKTTHEGNVATKAILAALVGTMVLIASL